MLYLYEELEKTTNTGCWQVDLVTNELFWSPQTYRIHGIEIGEKMDVDSAINHYHPEDRSKITELFNNLVQNLEEFRAILRIIDNNGNVKYVESYGKPLFTDNKLTAVFGTFKDVTKEVSIVSSKRSISNEFFKYKQSLENFFIVAHTDKSGVITHVNDKFCEISKYSREEIIGKTHRLISSGLHPKSFYHELWKKILKGEIWTGQFCNKAKDGKLYWVETFIFPKLDIHKNITGFTALRYDITEEKEIEKELAAEKERASFSAQLAAVGEISAGIAHEIANPLSIISGQTKIIPRIMENPQKFQKSLDSIDKASKRIEKIIKGLHHLSQKSRDNGFYNTNLSTIVSNTLEFCEEAMRSMQIKLIYELPKNQIEIFCNETQISQVLLNLINNAKDAIKESTVKENWIKIDFVEDYEHVKIHVIDSGPGIAPENREKLTQSFFTTKPIGKGTGLGLSLVNRFVKEHNGEFYLNDSFNNTCFTIILPKAKAQAA
ncbi:PAS domain S-box protein [Halobacteriovorax sp. HLS]|uniref:PAS domain S-box protein n=1 Tax=Halobacteriovorax sp. HLS TaxID=2234000 RepID=UPI000FD80111|nr:PAS domain S-box protein [Halobacteriovorax sp. HLS]